MPAISCLARLSADCVNSIFTGRRCTTFTKFPLELSGGSNAKRAPVASFAAATGARFALLPPDNSSGNFVKVVQRLPVKIEFTQSADSLAKQLIAGMNVTVDVHLD